MPAFTINLCQTWFQHHAKDCRSFPAGLEWEAWDASLTQSASPLHSSSAMLHRDLCPFLTIPFVAACPHPPPATPSLATISAFMACWFLSTQNSPSLQPAQSDMVTSHPPPCTPKCSFSGSPAATDHTDCSHHFLQTKVTSQRLPLLLGTSRNTAPGHRTIEIHKPGVTFFYKVLGAQ